MTMARRKGDNRPRPARDAGPGWRVLRYPGLSRPLVLQEGTGLERGLGQVLRGWEPQVEVTRVPAGQALACLYPEAPGEEGFALHSAFADAPFRGLEPAGALCGLVADLGQAYFDERPGSIALHCGAFRMGGRLIAVSGQSKAGKSTLTARMTAEADVEVYCDDILPILPDGRAVGLGMAPRLRLPLPEAASAAFRAHVAEYMGPRDSHYGYVCSPNLAPHGTTARLSVLVKLDRRAGGPARLYRIGRDVALTELLQRNMAEHDSAEETFARGAALLGGLTAVTLVYSDLEEAVALLRRAFGPGGTLDACVTPGAPEPGEVEAELPAERPDPDLTLARARGVAVRRMGGAAYLWRPDGTMIWHLNPVAAAVWALLDIPGSAREIAEALAEVFADVTEERLLSDVADLMGRLFEEGFLRQG